MTHPWLSDRDDPRVVAALTRKCNICHVPPGELCWNTVQPSVALPGRRLVHVERATG